MIDRSPSIVIGPRPGWMRPFSHWAGVSVPNVSSVSGSRRARGPRRTSGGSPPGRRRILLPAPRHVPQRLVDPGERRDRHEPVVPLLRDVHLLREVEADPQTSAFPPRERLLLRLVDELHDTAQVSESLWQELRAEWTDE